MDSLEKYQIMYSKQSSDFCTNYSKPVTDLLGTFRILENFYPISGGINVASAEIN